MAGNLVIVESPTKAGTIQKYLGSNYIVKASEGHIRDLQDNKMSVDIENGFMPEYVIPAKKKPLIKELKALADKADSVLLASDEDREGEAISWHLFETLGLDRAKTKRIVFHEITKPAILNAVENPREIDMNLVNAQQARRVLDRLVGFELSPILWRRVQKGLSAGRVQSVTLRLVVDREREIMAFRKEAYYKVTATFHPEGTADGVKVSATLDKRFGSYEEAYAFLQDSIGAAYTISSIEKKEGTRTPAAPFTTSTLQQEASRKLHLSSNQTMRIAQSLYEKGLITYMRTDSVNLSSLAINTAKKYIVENMGEEYSKVRQYRTSSKGAQEAHEAIRPTYIENTGIQGTAQEQSLYRLIWNRTVASQMADAKVMRTDIRIASDKRQEKYALQTTEVLFDGFLKLYMEGSDDVEADEEVILPSLAEGCRMTEMGIAADCKFTQAPPRYSEATLIKKMEEIGIGRPSTYATTISTLTSARGYLSRTNKEGEKVEVRNLVLKGGAIKESTKTEVVGAEKGKLVPQEIGMIVTDYLVGNFSDILDYNFTANVETDFDTIAEGGKVWNEVIGQFYTPFHQRTESVLQEKNYTHVERELGTTADGQKVFAKFGQYGPYVQKGEGENKAYANIPAGQLIENMTLEDALKLFELPRTVGTIDGVDVIATTGRFGPYLKYGTKNISLPRGKNPLAVTLEECSELIAKAAEKSAGPIAQWGDIQVIEGTYGPYIKYNGSNYKLPKGTDPSTLTEEQCRSIVESGTPTQRRTFRRRSK